MTRLRATQYIEDPPRWLMVFLGAMVVLGVLFGFGRHTLRKGFEQNAQFCRSCHEPNISLSLFGQVAHSEVACQQCHQVDEEAMYEMLVATVLEDHGRAHAAVKTTDGSCHRCHLGSETPVDSTMRSPGHVQHRSTSCLRCHGSEIHGVRRHDNACGQCHEDIVQRTAVMGPEHCTSCHNFVDSTAAIMPSREDCRGCHERRRIWMPDFDSNGHMGRLPCSACHEPHSVPTGCEGCHPRLTESPLHAAHERSACKSCHLPHAFIAAPQTCTNHHHSQKMEAQIRAGAWSVPGEVK